MIFNSRKNRKKKHGPKGLKVVPSDPRRSAQIVKGWKGGPCNITACQKPNSAFYFNKSTRAYYCRECAREINWLGGRADCMRLFGTPYLCELDPGDTYEELVKKYQGEDLTFLLEAESNSELQYNKQIP